MLEQSPIVSESSGIGAGKVIDKKAHFKTGAIDFTAGSLGKENLANRFCSFWLQSFSFQTPIFRLCL